MNRNHATFLTNYETLWNSRLRSTTAATGQPPPAASKRHVSDNILTTQPTGTRDGGSCAWLVGQPYRKLPFAQRRVEERGNMEHGSVLPKTRPTVASGHGLHKATPPRSATRTSGVEAFSEAVQRFVARTHGTNRHYLEDDPVE